MLFLTCLSIYGQNSNRNFEDSKNLLSAHPLDSCRCPPEEINHGNLAKLRSFWCNKNSISIYMFITTVILILQNGMHYLETTINSS